MAAYSELQQAEFAAEPTGYTATRHQREVGVGYFDAVAMTISGGQSSTTAFAGSTEQDQFHDGAEDPVPAHRVAAGAAPRRPAAAQDHDDGLVHNHNWAVSEPAEAAE